MRPRRLMIGAAFGIAATVLLVGIVMFTLAVPRQVRPTGPMTNDDWEILSNTLLTTYAVRVNAEPFGAQLRHPSEVEFRRILKSLMPFEATLEVPGRNFDYELLYQGGREPTTIRVAVCSDQLLFCIDRRPTLYLNRSAEAFLNAMKPLLGGDQHAPKTREGTSDAVSSPDEED